MLGAPLQTGCGPSEPTEISAATSGFLPSDKSKSNTNAPTKPETASPSSTPTAPVGSQPTAPATANPGQSNTASLPTAPTLPTFEPGTVDPKIAAKEYMKLALGDVADAKGLVSFLEKSTRAVRELIADGRRKLLSTDVLLERGMELSRMKVQAADRLQKIAATDDEKAAAILGKLEGLSQMANFRDVNASDELRGLAKQETENADPRVSQQAKTITLSFVISDYQSGGAKSEDIVKGAVQLLADPKALTMSNLAAISQAVDAMDRKSEEAAALELAQKTEEAFRDHEEAQFALTAWQLYASRLEETKAIGTLLESEQVDAQDASKAKEVIDAVMAKIPSPWTAFYLARIAIDLEYSGRQEIAKAIISVAQTRVGDMKNEDAKNELASICSQFEKRQAILNKPLDMSSLVTADGKPFDIERYKGKVVLVDFWASWCGPCLQEIPNIEAVYNAKNKDGFEVVGVNLDTERSKLDGFLASKKLLWTTYVSNDPAAQGFESPLAKNIGISAIPFIAVIGKDGNVAAIHVRGPRLENKIAELLAKE